MCISKYTLIHPVTTFIDETECLIRHHAIFKIHSWQFCISNVPMHSIRDPLKTQRWNLGCTWHYIAGTVEFENTNDNSCTLRQTHAKNAVEGGRRNRWEIQRERPSRCERAKSGEDGERCCILKGDIPWMIFYSWSSSPSATSTSSRSSQSRWRRSCRTAVSSASKRGSRPGLMDFTTPWGPLNPHSLSPLTSRSRSKLHALFHTRFHISTYPLTFTAVSAGCLSSPSRQTDRQISFYYALLDHPLRCIGFWRMPMSEKTSKRWIRF